MAARRSRKHDANLVIREPSHQTMRVEHDSIGPVEVPADALYGAQTVRSITNLSFSAKTLGSYPSLSRALGQVKRAAARANVRAKVLPRKFADAIDHAAQPLVDADLADELPADVLGGGGWIGVHMNVNEVLANLANERLGGRRGVYDPIHPKQHVNASQSTADVCHTASRLAILDVHRDLTAVLLACAAPIDAVIEISGDVPTLARTCLRDGMATPVRTLFWGYQELLRRRNLDLAAAVLPLEAITLGGTVIGTGDGAPTAYRRAVVPLLSEITGRALRARPSLPDALQNSDDLGAVSAQLALLARSLLKLAQDLRLLGSGPKGGFNEVQLPHVQEGSSFFSNKANPVVAESLIQCCLQVLGCDHAAQAAVQSAELHLNVFDGVAAINVIDAMTMLTEALLRFEQHCLRGLTVDVERCRALARLAH